MANDAQQRKIGRDEVIKEYTATIIKRTKMARDIERDIDGLSDDDVLERLSNDFRD